MLGWSKRHDKFKEKMRNFCTRVIEPQAAEIDRSNAFPQEIIRALADEGILGLPVPKQYGGAYQDALTWFIALEEVAAASGSVANILASHSLCAYVIEMAGTEEQKQGLLAELGSGAMLGAMAMTERQAGTDLSAITSTAERQNGNYLLQGCKALITSSGPAQRYAVLVKTDPEKGAQGISVAVVDKGVRGLGFGDPYDLTGMRGCSVADLFLKDCLIPAKHLAGGEGAGFKAAMMALDRSRPGVGAICVGIASKALKMAVDRAKERFQFGKPIADQQLIQAKLAEMDCNIDAARILVYRAGWLRDKGAKRFTREAASAKWFASDVAIRATSEAMQIYGGWGCTREIPTERMWRDSRCLQIADGTNEILRVLIAQMLLN